MEGIQEVLNLIHKIIVLGRLNHLWKYNGENWSWISGSSVANTKGNYGEFGKFDTNYYPGSRSNSRQGLWFDSFDNLYIFGGWGFGAPAFTGEGMLNFFSCFKCFRTIERSLDI